MLSYTRLVECALEDSAAADARGKRRGRCTDRRFGWKVISGRDADRAPVAGTEADVEAEAEPEVDAAATADATADADIGAETPPSDAQMHSVVDADNGAETPDVTASAAPSAARAGSHPHHEPRDPVREALLGEMLSDGHVGGRVIGALFDRACRVRDCRVVLSGSTGTRELVASVTRGPYPFDAADVDVDVYAPPDARDAAVRAVERALTDLLSDRHFVAACVERVPAGRRLRVDDTCKRNSALILRDAAGHIVRVEIPRFARAMARLPYSPVYVTQNRTLDDVVLFRVRMHIADDDAVRHFSVALVDVKVRTTPVPRLARSPVLYGGAIVRVPSAEAAVLELDRLLGRQYSDVDESKDDRRRWQRRVLERLLSAEPRRSAPADRGRSGGRRRRGRPAGARGRDSFQDPMQK